ncbi:unnamed protein product [Euphydryas editha]|uniref:HAT C-terminal dimerisation domain-containing protein n=1 Tax=Euphydryas editha TaxID=104508 RepID=A0AAU9UCE3_EUPED|nr:unnamed protein product [Euphydryas editha]
MINAADIAKKRAIDMASTLIGNSVNSLATEVEPHTSSQIEISTNEVSIWDDFDREVKGLQPKTTPRSKAITEIGAYLDDALSPRNAAMTPLDWWRNNRHLYPTFFKLFVKRGNFLATSVPYERIFSKAGYIVSERRTWLTSEKVRQLFFWPIFINCLKL